MFNEKFLYSTFYICIQQYAFSFNFNQNHFHPTKIFVQLQPELFSFNSYSEVEQNIAICLVQANQLSAEG